MEVCVCGAENTESLTWDAERGHISDHQKNRSVTHKGCNKHHVPPGPGDWQGRDQHTQQELGSTDRTGLELHLVYKQVGEDIDDALKLCVWVGGVIWLAEQRQADGRKQCNSFHTITFPRNIPWCHQLWHLLSSQLQHPPKPSLPLYSAHPITLLTCPTFPCASHV